MKQIRTKYGTDLQTIIFNYFVSTKWDFLTQFFLCLHVQQNGVTERMHRYIPEVARALRFQANLPIKFWGECILAAYLINHIPTRLLSGKSPYEILFYRRPNYSHLRVFGCLCYTSVSHRSRDKFHERATACLFVGYSLTSSNNTSSDASYPLTNFLSYSRFTSPYTSLFVAITQNDEPKSYKQAIKDISWQEAMK